MATGKSRFRVMKNTSPKSSIIYFGHSTVLIEMDGMRILTDPILRDRVSFLRRTSPAIDPTSYQDVDAVLISHLHYDHLDISSLQRLGNHYRLIAPRNSKPVLKKSGLTNADEIQIGDSIRLGSLSVRATYADHVRSRHPLGPSADCIGYLISGSACIYFPGDTRLFPQMACLAGEQIDLALVPVWGWGPNRGKMHMGPMEAAQALNLVRPRMAVPIHWGTFIPFWLRWMKPAFHYFPPLDFAAHANQIAPQVKVHVLLPGETLHLGN